METIVKIKWNEPEMKEWLCADNIKIALSSYCKNTIFEVEEIELSEEDDDVKNFSDKLLKEICKEYKVPLYRLKESENVDLESEKSSRDL